MMDTDSQSSFYNDLDDDEMKIITILIDNVDNNTFLNKLYNYNNEYPGFIENYLNPFVKECIKRREFILRGTYSKSTNNFRMEQKEYDALKKILYIPLLECEPKINPKKKVYLLTQQEKKAVKQEARENAKFQQGKKAIEREIRGYVKLSNNKNSTKNSEPRKNPKKNSAVRKKLTALMKALKRRSRR